MKVLDITEKKDIVYEMRGRFDVVHASSLATAVMKNDTGPVLEGLMLLLSGFLLSYLPASFYLLAMLSTNGSSLRGEMHS